MYKNYTVCIYHKILMYYVYNDFTIFVIDNYVSNIKSRWRKAGLKMDTDRSFMF